MLLLRSSVATVRVGCVLKGPLLLVMVVELLAMLMLLTFVGGCAVDGDRSETVRRLGRAN